MMASSNEKTKTAFIKPVVARSMPHEADMAKARANMHARKTRFDVQKQATANKMAPMSFTTGFRRCSSESPGTYSRKPFIGHPLPQAHLRHRVQSRHMWASSGLLQAYRRRLPRPLPSR